MKILHRSVLATGIAVALVSQAPIVALADSSPITDPVNIEATNPQNESAETGPTQVTITINQGDPENNDFTTTINTNGDSSTNNNYGDATVRVNDNIVVENESSPALTVSSTATTTVTNGDKTNALIVVIDNKTVSSKDSNGYGEAISTSGNGNVVGLGTTVNGSITNSGQGDIDIQERIDNGADTGNITDVTVSGTGDVAIVGDVYGNISNNDAGGNVYIQGDVVSPSTGTTTIKSTGTITDSTSNDKVVVVMSNATVIDGTVSEDQLPSDLSEKSTIFVYKVEDGTDDGGTVNKNPHYIIRSNSGIAGVYKADADGNNTGNALDYVVNTASPNMSMPATYSYANQGDVITFYIPTGYDYDIPVYAKHVGGGRYTLVVPAGGDVTLRAWARQVIEDTISSETGTPATVVDEDPSTGGAPIYTGDIGSVDGIDFISTDAGLALPTTELGDAVVATLSVSLDMSKVTPVQFRDAVTTTIGRAPVGGVAVIETSEVATLDSNMIAAMQTRPDVEYVIVFKHDGFKKKVVIPAGYDYSLLLDENGYCGFLRLAALLGFTYLD